ncbi:MAG: CoA pyrophosphatase [Myxococcales bacterium]|nr:CoA pyrophosphatase [Myxococcales bacterium]
MLKLKDVQVALRMHSSSRAYAAPLASNPKSAEIPSPQRTAAVSAIFRESGNNLELMFIKRAETPKDPWSGHMAFPGGRMEPNDSSPLATAIRETHEEVELQLHEREMISELTPVPAFTHQRPQSLNIYPYAFALDNPCVDLRPNHKEVQEIMWIPVTFFVDPSHRTTLHTHNRELPCYRYSPDLDFPHPALVNPPTSSARTNQPRVIWGLTLVILDELLQRIANHATAQGSPH